MRELPARLSLGAAALAALAFALAVCARLGYDYELEWQEGGMLAHALRLVDGRPLYAPPSLEFAAFPYPPLFHCCSAALIGLGLDGFLAMRLVTLLATLASCALLFELGRAQAGVRAGLLGAGLYLAAYRFAGAWLDIGRVDSLSLCLTLAGLRLAGARSVRAALLAGLCFALATWSKQSALPVALGVGLFGLCEDRRRGGALLGALLALLSLAYLWMQARSDGWFRWYVIDLLAGHPLYPPAIAGFWRELGLLYSPLIALAVWRLFERGRESFALTRRLALASGLLLLTAFVSRVHVGGYDNAFLPACLALACCAGPLIARGLEERGWRASATAALCVLQFALLAYDPRAQAPAAQDEGLARAWVERLEEVEGPVFAPHAVELARRAGKGSSLHAMSLIDILRGSDPVLARQLVGELEEALRARRFGAIVLADTSWERDLPLLSAGYRRAPTPLDAAGERALTPPTGAAYRPCVLYLPR